MVTPHLCRAVTTAQANPARGHGSGSVIGARGRPRGVTGHYPKNRLRLILHIAEKFQEPPGENLHQPDIEYERYSFGALDAHRNSVYLVLNHLFRDTLPQIDGWVILRTETGKYHEKMRAVLKVLGEDIE